MPYEPSPAIDWIERRLLLLAGLFLFFTALALTLSPAARTRSWSVDLRWSHWLGFLVWSLGFALVQRRLRRLLPNRDPYLLPVAAALSGWGLMTVWRLLPGFGARQTVWLALSLAFLAAGAQFPQSLALLRRYKYVWLTSALLLLAATLLLGVNPLGYGPRMWLGCCGVYLQPSELLKLLLVVYLAAYMADRRPFLLLAESGAVGPRPKLARLLPLLAPTLVMIGLALALLLMQRDLGAAMIFFLLYAAVVYLASGERGVLILAGLGLMLSVLIGYRLFDVVQTRVDSWLNPWVDPSGRSYQIIQALIAIANGGMIGRGPGLGSPGLAPLAHSDLIFVAIAEEFGLAGVVALFTLFGLLTARGLRIALQAQDHYRRYLAAGLVALLTGQALLIIAGNLRLLPLTGVTLPFVSYGGSSLAISFICLLLLLLISDRSEAAPVRIHRPAPYLELGGFLFLGLTICALAAGWWMLPRAAALLSRTDNQRRAIADRYVKRGALLDRDQQPISVSSGEPGAITRRVVYPELSNVVGYTNATYGQAGLEASLDEYLRGERGNPGLLIWQQRLLYGQPPPGLDVRLTLDLDLQRLADEHLKGYTGTLIALNAENGEILAMSSHPTFDANLLDEQWESLVKDPRAPLVNRATLSRYPLDDLAERLFPQGLAALGVDPLPAMRLPLNGAQDSQTSSQGISKNASTPTPPGLQPTQPARGGSALPTSPLQAALAAATLTNQGVRPAAEIVSAVLTPLGGWTPLERLSQPQRVMDAQQALAQITPFALPTEQIWMAVETIAPGTPDAVTWVLAGTLPEWRGAPYALAVIFEGEYPDLAEQTARALLNALMGGQSAALNSE
ncbi:MAG: FtsW/RodA/SpoVE family cell cycle protein [Anaerolineales bacterium]|nr:FtsW/RodA/SpoVE family cell cycle protein [Anaerolineales bacterium]